MKVFDIFFDWFRGLWAGGNILSRFVAILGVIVGMVLAIIAIILDFGIKLFKIFWDETLFYSSKGYGFLNQILSTLNQILHFLIYYLLKLLSVLNPKTKTGTKPNLKGTFLFSIIKNTAFALFFYSVSIVIFIISIYWLLTYVELLTYIGQWILSLFDPSYSLLNAVKGVRNSLESWSTKMFSVNLFSVTLIWLIRIIGFCGIFLFRFLRLRKNNSSLDLSGIVPYKKPFWDNQVQINSNYRVIYSIAFSVLIVLLVLEIFFFPNRDNNLNGFEPQKESIGLPISDSLSPSQSLADIKNKDSLVTPIISTEKKKQKASKINIDHSEKKDQLQIQVFNLNRFKTTLTNALVNIKAKEYNYSLKQLDIASNMKNIPLDLKKQISEAKTFIKAKEETDAIRILNQIINSH